MGVGSILDRLAAGWLADMRSKQTPMSTSRARLAALFPPLTPGGGGGEAKGVESEEEPRTSSPLGPGGPFTCSQCGGAYPTREQLERHETLHSPSTQSCKICHKSFANVYRLQRHMISHDESANLRKFKCNDCDKAFKFKHHLKEHLRIHSGEKPFGCANCGKKFSHSGSYSSHMTSKKCLIMNLKMGRIKPNNPALNPDRSPSRKRSSAALVASQLNNNIVPNGAFLNMSKYTDAATALFASMHPHDGNFPSTPSLGPHGVSPFYLPPSMQMSPPNGMSPYSSFTHILEQLASSQYNQNKLASEMRNEHQTSDPEDLIEEVTEEDDKRSTGSSAHDLVMDIDEEVHIKKERQDENRSPQRCYDSVPENHEQKRTLGGLNMILETVNASVTKHLLQANMQKLSPMSANTCPSIESPPTENFAVKPDPDQALTCPKCNAIFNHQTELLQHEKMLCGGIFRKHEGLAAQVAETFAVNRIEAEFQASIHSGVSASEDEEYSKEEPEGKPSTQDSERKIRVRTAISEEQQNSLKEHYAINARPNRDEFKKIAHQLGLDNRVVQVWFQNNRARVRRMNQTNQNLPFSDQPLDLSTKKSSASVVSTPSSSPPCSMSITHSDSGEEAVNLSQKSSRSTTPHRINYQNTYQHSNCSSSSFADFRHSPSPGEMLNGHRRLPQKMPMNSNLHLMPMEKLLQYSEMTSRAPLLNMHLSGDMARNHSPSIHEKRPWSDEVPGSNDSEYDEAALKKRMKLGAQIKEGEGQFVCDQCDKTFVKQSSLARHKYEHSGQRPYKCVECPKAFKHKHHLTEHKRLHTGEKPFQCCKCLKKFSHSGSYSQHMNHRYSFCKPYRE